MQKRQPLFPFWKAPLPSILTVFFLICFVFLYLLVIRSPVEPFYGRGLLFGVPFLCFVLITALSCTGKLRKPISHVVSIVMLIVCLLFSLCYLFSLAMEAAFTETTNIHYYERALSQTNYPMHPGVSFFPKEIPQDAEEVQFKYHPAILQGGEVLCLKYTVDTGGINQYINQLSQRAKWVGAPTNPEAEQFGIFTGSLNVLDYEKTLPADLLVYLMYSRPYQVGNWNHGVVGLVAISEKNREILFSFEDW